MDELLPDHDRLRGGHGDERGEQEERGDHRDERPAARVDDPEQGADPVGAPFGREQRGERHGRDEDEQPVEGREEGDAEDRRRHRFSSRCRWRRPRDHDRIRIPPVRRGSPCSCPVA